MHMQVKHPLVCVSARIDDQPVARLVDAFLFRKSARYNDHMAYQAFILRFQIVNGLNMPVGYEQNMCRGNRVTIMEGGYLFILKNNVTLCLPCNDPAKDTLVQILPPYFLCLDDPGQPLFD